MRSVRHIINPPLVSLRAYALMAVLGLLAPSAGAEESQSPSATQAPSARVPASVAHEISQSDEVVITEEGERITYEYWANGEMRVVRVVPAVGPEYYLYPEDQTLETGVDQSDPLLVRWKLLEF